MLHFTIYVQYMPYDIAMISYMIYTTRKRIPLRSKLSLGLPAVQSASKAPARQAAHGRALIAHANQPCGQGRGVDTGRGGIYVYTHCVFLEIRCITVIGLYICCIHIYVYDIL